LEAGLETVVGTVEDKVIMLSVGWLGHASI